MLCAGKTVEVNNTDAEGRLTLGDALWYAQVRLAHWQRGGQVGVHCSALARCGGRESLLAKQPLRATAVPGVQPQREWATRIDGLERGHLSCGSLRCPSQEKAGATSIVDSATLTGAAIIALGGEIAALLTPSDQLAASLQAAAKAAGAALAPPGRARAGHCHAGRVRRRRRPRRQVALLLASPGGLSPSPPLCLVAGASPLRAGPASEACARGCGARCYTQARRCGACPWSRATLTSSRAAAPT